MNNGYHVIDGVKKYSHVWHLIDDSSPKFNIWECCVENGNTFRECFNKECDPNLAEDFKEMSKFEKIDILKRKISEGYSLTELSNAYNVRREYLMTLITYKRKTLVEELLG